MFRKREPEHDRVCVQCTYEIDDGPFRGRVRRSHQCRNRTAHPSARCHLHRLSEAPPTPTTEGARP